MLNFGDDHFFVKYAPCGDLSVMSLHRYFIRRSVGTRRYILHFALSDCGMYAYNQRSEPTSKPTKLNFE